MKYDCGIIELWICRGPTCSTAGENKIKCLKKHHGVKILFHQSFIRGGCHSIAFVRNKYNN